MKNYEMLPPIIVDLINDLRKDDTAMHIRDNISARLENIVACASEAVEIFKRKQVRHYSIKSKQKV